MGKKLIGAAVLFAIYKFAPNQVIKAMVLGAAGTWAAGYVPFVNGKDVAGTVAAIKSEVA